MHVCEVIYFLPTHILIEIRMILTLNLSHLQVHYNSISKKENISIIQSSGPGSRFFSSGTIS
ncbi:hypothetical protein Hanom_Chr09g00851591 [Helianthus anomalus]